MDETGAEPSAKPAQTPPEDPLLAPRLNAGQLALLHRYGQVRPTVAGQELFREGDRGYDFIVIVSGAVTILDHQAGVARELATGGPGEFVAELNLFTGERLFTTAVVKEPGSILVVPVDRMQRLFAQDQALADLIMQTSFRRRQWLLAERAGMRIIGSRSSADARGCASSRPATASPTSGSTLRPPRRRAWCSAITASARMKPRSWSCAVVRSCAIRRTRSWRGPLDSAPARWRRARPSTSPWSAPAGWPGRLGVRRVGGPGRRHGRRPGGGRPDRPTSRIENYLGLRWGERRRVRERALVQVLRFGRPCWCPARPAGWPAPRRVLVRLAAGDELDARTVIIANGVSYRKLDADGLDRFEGPACSTCCWPPRTRLTRGRGRDRGRWQLGRPGRDLARRSPARGDDRDPRRRSGRQHVAVPDRSRRPASRHRGRRRAARCGSLTGRPGSSGWSIEIGDVNPADADLFGPVRSRSAPSRTPGGSPGPSSWTATASWSPDRTSAMLGEARPGQAEPRCPTCWRRACPACSRPATSQRLGQAGRFGRRRGLDRHPLRQRAPRPAHRIRRRRPLRPVTAPPTEIDLRRHS